MSRTHTYNYLECECLYNYYILLEASGSSQERVSPVKRKPPPNYEDEELLLLPVGEDRDSDDEVGCCHMTCHVVMVSRGIVMMRLAGVTWRVTPVRKSLEFKNLILVIRI